MIPFSPPRIDQKIIDEVVDTLKSGWITTGPKTKLFEKKITSYCGCKTTVAVNSATAGLELVLRWFDVGPGDEVIVPAYTYCATANVVVHCGARPVMVDVNPDDFSISVDAIRKAITIKTKAVMPVDMAGFPCDYDAINNLVNEPSVSGLFTPGSPAQEKLGRILVLADAAHSFGAVYKGKKAGSFTDISVFSFHAIKNLTTAEGGSICFNLPGNFDHDEIYRYFSILVLHGQSKDALAKMQKGAWRYDVIESGYKANMTDIQASIGLIEIERYDNDTLVKRKHIFERYCKAFEQCNRVQLPVFEDSNRKSSYHVFLLRITGISEIQRDSVIQRIFDKDVAVNVHFQPLPLLSAFKNKGYKMTDYPVAFDNYSREVSLPVYYDLNDVQVDIVIKSVMDSMKEELIF